MSLEDQSSKENLLFKIIIVGDAGVGKTCILNQYTHKEFKPDYNVTIGVEFSSKTVQLDENTKVKLQIWDTAGQESFRSIIKSFYKNAAAIFLVYNITKKESFIQIQAWLKEAQENAQKSSVIILVGNQCDKEEEREVSYEQGMSFMKENSLAFFFETSAKTGTNIENAFTEVAKIIFLKYINMELLKISQGKGLKPNISGEDKKKKKCC